MSTNYPSRKTLLLEAPRTCHAPVDKHVFTPDGQQASQSREARAPRSMARTGDNDVVKKSWSLFPGKQNSRWVYNAHNEHSHRTIDASLLEEDFVPWRPDSSLRIAPRPSRIEHRGYRYKEVLHLLADLNVSNNGRVVSDSRNASGCFFVPRLTLTPPTPTQPGGL